MSSTVEARMSRDVLSVSPSDSIAEAAQVMVERRVGSALVTERGALIGIITERDLLRAVARALVPWTTAVSECMTADPIVLEPDAPAGRALHLMMSKGFRHLPVMKDGKLVGILSLRDLVTGLTAGMTAEQLSDLEDLHALGDRL